jgi:hypothetical protein
MILDTWLDDMLLCHKYPSLYNILQQKDVYVASYIEAFYLGNDWKKWKNWLHLLRMLTDIELANELCFFN